MKAAFKTNQLTLDFSGVQRNFRKVVRNFRKLTGDDRARDSEGRYASDLKEMVDKADRLELQNRIMRVNHGIWERKKENEINELKAKLKRYE